MNKGWFVRIALVVIIAIIAYVYTGFSFGPHARTTTSVATTSIIPIVNSTSTISVSAPLSNCDGTYIQGVAAYSSSNATCRWGGGTLGVWVMAGNAYSASIKIVGADGKTYLQGGFNYNTTTFFSNVTLPAQNYTVTLSAGSEASTGGAAFIKLNLTTTPPSIVYNYIFNANFSNGQYTGWNVTGSGFGSAPLNISYANANGCYFGQQWANLEGQFFATTYTCGLSVSPGNLTSEAFLVNPKTPFLNFRLVSPDDSLIYIEILEVNGANQIPVVIGRFNTYNISEGPNVSSTFANATIPLTTLTNKVVRIRVVAATIQTQRYVAIGDFSLGNLPNTQKGISSQINITR